MVEFLGALDREIAMYETYRSKEEFETVFFGGGTPSLLSPTTVRNVLELLSRTFEITPDAEITLETNPGTVDEKKLEGYLRAGVNRLSFGVQSFHNDDLKFLTRIHTSEEADFAIRAAREAGFDNINLDLIFALPNQTMERWEQNLRHAIGLEPRHISAYSLIVEQNTPLARMVRSKLVSPLPVETEADMYNFTMQYLYEAGFRHYEVSNYAQPGFQSRHNVNYWNHSNYLGFGPSAHSFWRGRRWWNISNIRNYCDRVAAGSAPVAGEEILTKEQLVDERVMLGLRSDGLNLRKLRNEFALSFTDRTHSMIESLVGERLAVTKDDCVCLTDKGFLLCDEITRRFLSDISCP